jgi:hypothetical protein
MIKHAKNTWNRRNLSIVKRMFNYRSISPVPCIFNMFNNRYISPVPSIFSMFNYRYISPILFLACLTIDIFLLTC